MSSLETESPSRVLAPPSPTAVSPPRHDYRPFPNEAGRNSRQARFEVPLMVAALQLPVGGRVLEVGCGRGVALGPLFRLLRPARLVGLDVDDALLAEAEEGCAAAGEIELVHGDVRRLPFPHASFDLVIDFGTCYHIGDSERALQEIARVLVGGGLFVHETPLSQLFAHPVRSFGRRIPWRASRAFTRRRTALLWSARIRADDRGR